MRKRLVGVVFLSVLAASCRYLPFWPFQREEEPSPSEDVIHLARNFCGVLVPDRGKLYGCRWYRDSTYNNELTRCLGIWERDVETGEMRPLWMDTSHNVTGYIITRDFRYLLFGTEVLTELGYQTSLNLLDLERTRIVDTIIPEFLLSGVGISPYTPEVFYVASLQNWGNTTVLWRLDFRTHEVQLLDRGGFKTGFYILPGKGDSVVRDTWRPGVYPVNYAKHLVVVRQELPDTFLLKNYATGKFYRLTAVPPREAYWYANRVWWVHERDSLLICTDWGGYHYPKRYDLWLIRNVTKHLQEVSP